MMTMKSKSAHRSLAGFKAVGLLVIPTLMIQLTGCGSVGLGDALPDQRLVYKKQREAGENLEIPPDLTGSNFNDAMDIPSAGGTATYSEYTGNLAQRRQNLENKTVLPTTPSVDLKRAGDSRWIEVKASPSEVWPRAIAFWREQGILLVEQNPAVGVMRTDWLDNRAEIRRDFITRMVSKVFEGAYSTSTRDQYSLRIEEGPRAGSTDIYLTHRGMEERLLTTVIGEGSRSVWEPSGSDSAKEAEMLRRLMVYLGASKQVADASSAAPADRGAPGSSSALVMVDGIQVLSIPRDFRQAWQLTGSALDRAGFAVEDRDQSQGVFYVRYSGRDGAESGDSKKPGFFSRVAFWRKKEIDEIRQYRIQVAGGESGSRVSVLDDKGRPDQSESGQRILELIREQLH